MLNHTISSEKKQIIGEETIVVKRSGKLVFFLLIVLLLAIVAFGWSFNNYRKYKNQVIYLSTSAGQQELVKKEMDVLLEKIGRHIMLPVDEQPTVATILDPEILIKDQPFYKGSQKGDKILIYVKAQKAIVYNETRDIIVNVGPVYLENKTQPVIESEPIKINQTTTTIAE